jgi:hypothetical protein
MAAGPRQTADPQRLLLGDGALTKPPAQRRKCPPLSSPAFETRPVLPQMLPRAGWGGAYSSTVRCND